MSHHLIRLNRLVLENIISDNKLDNPPENKVGEISTDKKFKNGGNKSWN